MPGPRAGPIHPWEMGRAQQLRFVLVLRLSLLISVKGLWADLHPLQIPSAAFPPSAEERDCIWRRGL